MGAVISRWRRKQSTEELLQDLHAKIESLEESKKTNVEKQKRLIGSLILYSVLLYIVAAFMLYFYYMPESWRNRVIYSLPMAAFPLLVWLTKRFLHWYFVKRIAKNDLALQELKDRKKTILEEVMEKETYKKAKEILEKYDPDQFKSLEKPVVSSPGQRTPDGQELRQRAGPRGPTPGTVRMAMGQGSTPMVTPTGPRALRPMHRPTENIPPSGQGNGTNRPMYGTATPGPPLPRPVLPRERTFMDKMIEYLMGDGPQNRYALICKDCQSHNGMALREEFEYISFRCCYCFTLNAARKQRPHAPRLEFTSPVVTQLTTADAEDAVAGDHESESEESMETEEIGQGQISEARQQGTSEAEGQEVTEGKKEI